MFTRYILAASAAVALSAGAWGWYQGFRAERALERAEAAESRAMAAEQSVAALEAQAAENARLATRDAQIKSEIDNAPDNDIPAPDWLRGLPERLRFDDSAAQPAPFAY